MYQQLPICYQHCRESIYFTISSKRQDNQYDNFTQLIPWVNIFPTNHPLNPIMSENSVSNPSQSRPRNTYKNSPPLSFVFFIVTFYQCRLTRSILKSYYIQWNLILDTGNRWILEVSDRFLIKPFGITGSLGKVVCFTAFFKLVPILSINFDRNFRCFVAHDLWWRSIAVSI